MILSIITNKKILERIAPEDEGFTNHVTLYSSVPSPNELGV